jgi:hypothetical protein
VGNRPAHRLEKSLGGRLVEDQGLDEAAGERRQQGIAPMSAVRHGHNRGTAPELRQLDPDHALAVVGQALLALAVEEPATDLANDALAVEPPERGVVEGTALDERRILERPDPDEGEIHRGEEALERLQVAVGAMTS